MAYLPITDFGNPKTFSAYARDAIVAGEFVFASGANNVVDSNGVSSFVTTDLLVAADGSGAQVVGMAVNTAASGAMVTVQTQGLVIVPANDTIVASYPLSVDGNNAVFPAGSVAANLAHQRIIGRALTSAASGGYCVVNLNL